MGEMCRLVHKADARNNTKAKSESEGTRSPGRTRHRWKILEWMF